MPGCVWGDGPSCFGYHDIKPQWKRQFHRGSVPPVAIWCLSVSRERSQACGKVPHASSPVNSNKGALIRSVVLAGGSMCQEKKARCSAEIRPSLQHIHQYVWTRRKSNSTFKEHNVGFGARLPWKMQPSELSRVWIHHLTLSHSAAASCDSKCHQVWGDFWKGVCSVLRAAFTNRTREGTTGDKWFCLAHGIYWCWYFILQILLARVEVFQAGYQFNLVLSHVWGQLVALSANLVAQVSTRCSDFACWCYSSPYIFLQH